MDRRIVKQTADFRRYEAEQVTDADGRKMLIALCEELDPESGRWEPFYTILREDR